MSDVPRSGRPTDPTVDPASGRGVLPTVQGLAVPGRAGPQLAQAPDRPSLVNSAPHQLATRAEIAGELGRIARVLRLGVFLWLGFLPISLWLASVYHAPWHVFVITRFTIAALLLLWSTIERWTFIRTPARVSVTTIIGGVSVSGAMGIEAAFLGGAQSPYIIGPAFGMVLLVTLQRHWRNALVPLMLTSLAYFGGLWAMSPFTPILRAPVDSYLLGTEALLLVDLAGFCTYVSHVAWRLRRELYDAKSLGRYELRTCIGRGGMGEVWSAYHTTLKRDVAVKILRTDRVDAAAVARFEHEVEATSALAHPNTVRVFDYGSTEDGTLYYAMELLDGISLAKLLASEGIQPPGRAAVFAVQVARALAEAHERGIIHRDLKLDNLLLTAAGGEPDFIKVIDFGIARILSEDHLVTRAGEIPGTPLYIAPELVSGLTADARADIYSLGVAMYLLTTGLPPFKGATPSLTMLAHVNAPLVPPRARGASRMSAELEDVILRCLARRPDERFATMAEVALALQDTPDVRAWKAESAARARRISGGGSDTSPAVLLPRP
ncbi:MAG: serine/threonine protein kinase [Kofleriaceae bacterium]|nr:serine/threonine protein kinase [Kofleriaceae bacterium]MBP6837099.1 serine/threonine protein kinase [Kofleriaceae bacterium]